jgi:hypothetical protein
MLMEEPNAVNLKSVVHYYVRQGVIRNIRKGVYAKEDYSAEELACCLYTPSYISLETVLSRAGVVFQFSGTITAISYLSRSLEIDEHQIAYRKVKNDVLVDVRGITREGNANIATPERAFLDRLYLSPDYYFDNTDALDTNLIAELLPVYRSKALQKRTEKVLNHD